MKTYARKFFRGLPRYDGVGSTVSALSISPDTLRAAQEADALLLVEVWENELLPVTAATAAARSARAVASRPH